MAKKDLIKVITDPKVPLKELWSTDTGSVTTENPFIIPGKGTRTSAMSVGSDAPFVKINSIPITEIDLLIIDETGKVPKIKIIFMDGSGALTGANYPKNDPILSLYIKSQNSKFKPIRCDFLITNIKTNQDPVLNAETIDIGANFIMTGELYIPKIYKNVSKSYRNMNSKDTLKKIASETDLGFACNEFITNDKMTWLNTNSSSLNFIDHVSKHSYLDDDTFFTSFIDKFYHLNFINVAEQLNLANEHNMTYDNTVDSSELDISEQTASEIDSDNLSEILSVAGLTNKDEYRGKPEYIINYSLMGNTGSILKNKGYKKKVYYYDPSLEEENRFTSFFVNPIEIKGYTGENKGLEPDDESLRESIIKKWMNIDYGNAHTEWNASALINDHNNSELNKVKLKVETAGINFQVNRGAAIPVMMYFPPITHLEKDIQTAGGNAKTQTPINIQDSVPDGIISGKYYVSGVRYIYDRLNDSFPFKTEFQLARVNWLGENNIVE